MNKKIIIFILLILITIGSVFAIKKANDNNVITTNNSQVESNSLSDEEKKQIIDKIKYGFENVTDRVIFSINGEEINERELAFVDYQLNNSAVNQNGEIKDSIHEITKDYVVYQNAKELNISLSDEDIEKIRDTVKSDEDVKELSKELNMSYDEFCEMYVNTTKRAKVEMKWIAYVGDKIANGEINIDNELFNNKYKEYSESKDIPRRAELLLEMLDIYKEYLVNQANIKKID